MSTQAGGPGKRSTSKLTLGFETTIPLGFETVAFLDSKLSALDFETRCFDFEAELLLDFETGLLGMETECCNSPCIRCLCSHVACAAYGDISGKTI